MDIYTFASPPYSARRAFRVALALMWCLLAGTVVGCGGGASSGSESSAVAEPASSVTPAVPVEPETQEEIATPGEPAAPTDPSTPETPSASASVHAIFLNHGFVANFRTDAAIAEVVGWLQQRKFTHQFLNLAEFSDDGSMRPEQYAALAHWIRVSKATDPDQKVIAYLNGSLDLVNNPAAWQNIANFCQTLLTQYGVDGINLDFEPFRDDNPNYLGLFSTIRNTVGPTAHLTLDYTSAMVWSGPFFKQVSQHFNWIMPMLYDTTCEDIACYKKDIDRALRFQYANLAPGVQLVPIVPSYADSTYHDAAVENICTATEAISALMNADAIKTEGLGVWWYYGWNSKAEQDWQSCWLNRER